jgi:hypothetical protein
VFGTGVVCLTQELCVWHRSCVGTNDATRGCNGIISTQQQEHEDFWKEGAGEGGGCGGVRGRRGRRGGGERACVLNSSCNQAMQGFFEREEGAGTPLDLKVEDMPS